MVRTHPDLPWCRYADDGLVHCRTEQEAQALKAELQARLAECQLEMHPAEERLAVQLRWPTRVFVCGTSRRGRFLIKRKSRRDRMRAKLQEVTQGISADAPADPRAREMAQTGRRRLLQVPRRIDQQPCPEAATVHCALRSYQRRSLQDAFSGMTRMRNSSLCVLGLHGFRGELGLRGDERHLGRDCDIAISIEHDIAPELTFPACSVAVHTRDVGHGKHLVAARKYLTEHWHGQFHDAAAPSLWRCS